jgi:hypothetical protein
MNLTGEQEEAVQNGKVVPVHIGNAECVVVRKDIYERVKAVLYDDGEMTDDELHAIAAHTLDDLDSAGPIQ